MKKTKRFANKGREKIFEHVWQRTNNYREKKNFLRLVEILSPYLTFVSSWDSQKKKHRLKIIRGSKAFWLCRGQHGSKWNQMSLKLMRIFVEGIGEDYYVLDEVRLQIFEEVRSWYIVGMFSTMKPLVNELQ
jgi:hypothetical protein